MYIFSILALAIVILAWAYYLCKKIYRDSLNNELKNNIRIPVYVVL